MIASELFKGDFAASDGWRAQRERYVSKAAVRSAAMRRARKRPPPTWRGRAEVATACPPAGIPWRSKGLAPFEASSRSPRATPWGAKGLFVGFLREHGIGSMFGYVVPGNRDEVPCLVHDCLIIDPHVNSPTLCGGRCDSLAAAIAAESDAHLAPAFARKRVHAFSRMHVPHP